MILTKHWGENPSNWIAEKSYGLSPLKVSAAVTIGGFGCKTGLESQTRLKMKLPLLCIGRQNLGAENFSQKTIRPAGPEDLRTAKVSPELREAYASSGLRRLRWSVKQANTVEEADLRLRTLFPVSKRSTKAQTCVLGGTSICPSDNARSGAHKLCTHHGLDVVIRDAQCQLDGFVVGPSCGVCTPGLSLETILGLTMSSKVSFLAALTLSFKCGEKPFPKNVVQEPQLRSGDLAPMHFPCTIVGISCCCVPVSVLAETADDKREASFVLAVVRGTAGMISYARANWLALSNVEVPHVPRNSVCKGRFKIERRKPEWQYATCDRCVA